MFASGLLNLNKPTGMTSRRAVDIVQRLAWPAKVGHAGTLDPLATGVLVVCVGPATRLIEYVQRMPKRYVAAFLLGRQSPTEDIEGQVTELLGARVPTADEVRAAASRFVGRIQQRPPAFSALKVGGRPAYELARQGRPAHLAARPVADLSHRGQGLPISRVGVGGRLRRRDVYPLVGTRFGPVARHCRSDVGPGADLDRPFPDRRVARSPPTQFRHLVEPRAAAHCGSRAPAASAAFGRPVPAPPQRIADCDRARGGCRPDRTGT